MSGDGPPLLRPIPRRPFDLNVSSPTPPDEDSVPPSPNPADFRFDSSQLLDPRRDASSTALADLQGGSLSRAQSIINLTASTLFGIYSPTTSGRGASGYYDRDEPGTPWGTGAETPARRRLSVDEPNYEVMKERSSVSGSRTAESMVPRGPRPSRTSTALSLAMRVALLFALGTGYGALVSRLQNDHSLASIQMDGIVMASPDYNWRYLAFWGVCGVVLGALLPWFDGVWDDTFGKEDRDARAAKESRPETDWALVIRGIGAFAGIVFAIRKLPWASTMQVSLTLALVNPFLWYLIDRSKPGFLLSSAVGLAGSAIMMGLNPEMMPAPAHHALGHYRNGSSDTPPGDPLVLGGLASQETVETGIWILSVLFCSCVCFGNIGRRLALSRKAATRGRWGGVR